MNLFGARPAHGAAELERLLQSAKFALQLRRGIDCNECADRVHGEDSAMRRGRHNRTEAAYFFSGTGSGAGAGAGTAFAFTGSAVGLDSSPCLRARSFSSASS